jgi:pyruvate dehydrogenase E2 component (dihydrolipoamide acetyltransferase)
MIEEVKIPAISENVTSGRIVAVSVQVGDTVQVDDVLVEIETDKAVVEIPSPVAGTVREVLVQSGEEKRVGDTIARIETETAAQAPKAREARDTGDKPGPAVPPAEPPTEAEAAPKPEAAEKETPKAAPEPPPAPLEPAPGKREAPDAPQPPSAAGPSVRRFARELGVEIREVPGSGPGGRITPDDITAHVKRRLGPQAGGAPPAPREPQLPDFSRWGEVRSEELETVRRLIAESTSVSWQTCPHVTQFDHADVTDLADFMQAHGASVQRRGGKLTLTAVLMKVCAEALRRFPRFNASIDMAGRRLIYKEYVHIGLAVDTPRGLLVPVIRDADRRSITDLAVEIVETAERARSRKSRPEEFEGGTFTISNQGGIGGVNFTPVILWPQAAILGVSRTERRFIEYQGDLVPRNVLPLALSYDHRINDGADAARFLRWICEGLARPMSMFV